MSDIWVISFHHIVDGYKCQADESLILNRADFEKEIEGLPSTRPVGELPPELHCPLCKEVMKDAVLTSKCCFKSFCDKCKLSKLLVSFPYLPLILLSPSGTFTQKLVSSMAYGVIYIPYVVLFIVEYCIVLIVSSEQNAMVLFMLMQVSGITSFPSRCAFAEHLTYWLMIFYRIKHFGILLIALWNLVTAVQRMLEVLFMFKVCVSLIFRSVYLIPKSNLGLYW